MIYKIFVSLFLFINCAFAASEVTVDFPTMDLDPVKVFVGAIVVFSLGCAALFFGMRKSSKALDPDGDSEYYWRKSMEK